jgi:hypothetical protein
VKVFPFFHLPSCAFNLDLFAAPVFCDFTPKRRSQDSLLIPPRQLGDVVEVMAGALEFRGEAINLGDDPSLFGSRRNRNDGTS